MFPSRSSGESRSPNRKPESRRSKDGALSLDIDIRLKSTDLVITRSQVFAVIAALAAILGWSLAR